MGAGFAGDRLEPAVDLVSRANLDALIFECLAERTIALAQLEKLENRGPGFDRLLGERLRQCLPAARAHDTVIVTNAGAANPHGAAGMVSGLAGALGLGDVRVAAVTGDDVLDRLDLDASPLLDDAQDKTLRDVADHIVSANAYLGAEGIVSALGMGANVIITGRTSDAALFLAPLMHWFGWTHEQLDLLAAGCTAGHLMECAGQLTGGYFADPPYKVVPGLAHLGFPFAEVTADGGITLAKLPGTGGRLDRATAVEQLLYEVGDPSRYVTPDVILDLLSVELTETAPNVVTVAGAVGHPRPEQLKVSVGLRDGYHAIAEISYAGPGAVTRAHLAAEIVTERWSDVHGHGGAPLSTALIGLGACTPWATPPEAADPPSEVRLRHSLRTMDDAMATLLCREVEGLYTNGPAGGGGVTARVVQTVGIVSTLLPRDAVQPVATMVP